MARTDRPEYVLKAVEEDSSLSLSLLASPFPYPKHFRIEKPLSVIARFPFVFTSFLSLSFSFSVQLRQDIPDEEPEEAAGGGEDALPPVRPGRGPHRAALAGPARQGAEPSRSWQLRRGRRRAPVLWRRGRRSWRRGSRRSWSGRRRGGRGRGGICAKEDILQDAKEQAEDAVRNQQ